MRRSLVIAMLLVFAGGLKAFKPLSLRVVMDNGLPVVEWAAESEDDVDHYLVEIRTYFNESPRTATFEPHGARTTYVFRNDDLYKGAETVEYSVFAVLDNGERVLVGPPQQINYTPTAVRRTWGSIKAMFQ